jgi:hypothetical protein
MAVLAAAEAIVGRADQLISACEEFGQRVTLVVGLVLCNLWQLISSRVTASSGFHFHDR